MHALPLGENHVFSPEEPPLPNSMRAELFKKRQCIDE